MGVLLLQGERGWALWLTGGSTAGGRGVFVWGVCPPGCACSMCMVKGLVWWAEDFQSFFN